MQNCHNIFATRKLSDKSCQVTRSTEDVLSPLVQLPGQHHAKAKPLAETKICYGTQLTAEFIFYYFIFFYFGDL